MIVPEHAIASLKAYVSEAFKAGTRLFPYYTLHGAEHLEELDRLAKLIGSAVRLPEEGLGLLRLAIAVHDYAMVNVPDDVRERELRRRLGDVPLDIVVRDVHHDEIERCFTEPQLLDYVTRLIPGANAPFLEDLFTIAQHHRRHALAKAPPHLRDLCALMRIVDELDIGPGRAPLPTYEALRSRMKPEEKIHWLKHICTRAVKTYETLVVEEGRGPLVVRVMVVVRATDRTWEALHDEVVSKLVVCLEDEQVNQVLRETSLRVEFAVGASVDLPSGATSWMPSIVRADLDALPERLFKKGHREQRRAAPAPPVDGRCSPGPVDANPTWQRTVPEFRIRAIPPERLGELLCESGKLTVIGNAYVAPEEAIVGGVTGARSRFYLGPADSGKTRAALEWIETLVGDTPGQWVVFRTDTGILPSDPGAFLLDTLLYSGGDLPSKGLLFLDDLPLNLPLSSSAGRASPGVAANGELTPGGELSPAAQALSGFLRWFRELPYLRERRVVGTVRLEDVENQPQWPDVLAILGQEVELIRVQPLNSEGYRELWEGMAAGAVSRSITRGIERFKMEIAPAFVQAVVMRPADPEAVATFIQQRALQSRNVLGDEDATGFSESAVETWLCETWPAVEQAYGVAARVFFTLARFLEARLRPTSGILRSMGPDWAYHERWGPELCAMYGGAAGGYLPVVDKLLDDGHAIGGRQGSVRPRLDFLVQAASLTGVELTLPEADWFLARSDGLGSLKRVELGAQLSYDPEARAPEDADLLVGWSLGLLGAGMNPINETRRVSLLERALAASRRAVEIDPHHCVGRLVMAQGLDALAEQAAAEGQAAELRGQATSAYRKVVEVDPGYWHGWLCFGLNLTHNAERELDPVKASMLREEALGAFRRGTRSDGSWAWYHLGRFLSLVASRERDPGKARAWLDEGIAALRKATLADSSSTWAWAWLGSCLLGKVLQESDPEEAGVQLEEGIAAVREAIRLDRNNSWAWFKLGIGLIWKAEQESDPIEAEGLRDEGMTAYRKAVGGDAETRTWAWYHLGLNLMWKADQDSDTVKAAGFRDEGMSAYRKAVEADPDNGWAWYRLGLNLMRKADEENDPVKARGLRDEGMSAYRKAVTAEPDNSKAWFHFGLSLADEAERADGQLEASARRDEEIAAYGEAVRADPKFFHAWFQLGLRLGEKAADEDDEVEASKVRELAVGAFRKAVEADPNHSVAWSNLGVALGISADVERDAAVAGALRDQAVWAHRTAVLADRESSWAWHNLGSSLGDLADHEADPLKASAMRDEEIAAYLKAVGLNPKQGGSWYNIGLRLGERADQEDDPVKARKFRDQEVAASVM